MKVDMTSKYILLVVGIVALVGIVVMIMNNMDSSFDISGQVVAAATSNTTTNCTDTDGGRNYLVKGTVSGGTWSTTGATYSAKTDLCDGKGKLGEFFCNTNTTAAVSYVNCTTVVGPGYYCSSGACVNTTVVTNTTTTNTTNTTSSTLLPDLIGDPLSTYSLTSSLPEIVVYSGAIVSSGVCYGALNFGIINQGTAVASGNITDSISLYTPAGTFINSLDSGTKSVNIPVGSTDTTTHSGTKMFYFYDSRYYGSSATSNLLMDLYVNGTARVNLTYNLNYYIRSGRYIVESNMSNNNGTIPITLTSTGLTFRVAECINDSVCAGTCTCYNYTCVGNVTYVSPTYNETTACI